MFFKKLFYKKKFIIYFLSAILTLLIIPNSVKALTIPTGYTDKYTILYNEQALNIYNYGHYNYYLIFSQSNRTSIYADTNLSCSSSSNNPNSLAKYYSILSNQSTPRLRAVLGSTDGENWTLITNNNSFNWGNFTCDTILLKTSVDVVNRSDNSIVYYSAGYEYTPPAIDPYSNVLYQGLITNSQGRDFYRYVFEIENYSDDYTYQYRLRNYNGVGNLTDWTNITFNDNLGRFVYDSYNNIRIELKITKTSDNNVVFDQEYVISAFTIKNLTISFLNNPQIDDLYHLYNRYNINASDYNTLDYYLKVSTNNGSTWDYYFTNNNFDINVGQNTTLIVEVYSLIDNENKLIYRTTYDVDTFLNGYDGYIWVNGYQFAFLSDIEDSDNRILFTKAIYDDLNTKPIVNYYNFTQKEIINEINYDSCRESIYSDYYCYNIDDLFTYKEQYSEDTIGIMINNSKFAELGKFFIPNNTYLSYTYYNGAGNDVDNYFSNIQYIDNNGDKQTIVDEDIFSFSITRYLALFYDIFSQPIILITKIIAYMYNSLNFYIKITVMTIFIQMIASAVIKLLRRY